MTSATELHAARVDPREPATRPRLAIAAKGFRPFFLLAALFAVAIVPIWILVVSGVIAPGAYLDPASWHAHEMIFGYAVAVIAGFLLTAVGNWTRRETLTGAPLLALAALWIAGRLAMAAAASMPRGSAAAIDLAFYPALLVALARPLVAARNKRNLVMLAIVAALFACDAVVHLDALGVAPIGSARHASLVALDVIVLLIVVITGRVVPMFTRNTTGDASIASRPALDRAAAIGMALVALLDAIALDSTAARVASGAAAALTLARATRWGTRRALRDPLLAVLHVGYFWVPFGLALRALPALGPWVWGSLATHALTVGALATLTLGMMARVSLGHTGRALVAPRPIAWAFVAITIAAIARVLVPLIDLRWHYPALVVAAIAWTIAFATFVVVYAPILATPRADGKAG